VLPVELTSRVVLLTGAKRIGAEIAAAVASAGADVAIAYRSSSAEAKDVAARVEGLGRRALLVRADVSDPASCRAMVAEVDAAFGRLDVLVNMASLYEQIPIDELDAEKWNRQISVDLNGTFFCSLAAVPLLRRNGTGRIINFSDWVVASGRPRYAGFVAYYTAKAGVKALTEALALELAPAQILVNAIAPGPILAPPGTSEDELDAVVKATPLGRWGGPEEIVKSVLALIASDFITGETIRVDGGRHLR
jgi:NAD(P)-dependent dehydrogenase (short-subunit alcohol dehydrogenase family)